LFAGDEQLFAGDEQLSSKEWRKSGQKRSILPAVSSSKKIYSKSTATADGPDGPPYGAPALRSLCCIEAGAGGEGSMAQRGRS